MVVDSRVSSNTVNIQQHLKYQQMPFRKLAEKRHLYYDYFIFIFLLLHATRAQPVNHTCLEMGEKKSCCRVELKSSQSAARLSSDAWRRWEKFKLFKMTRESYKSATQKLHTSTSHWGWHIGADMRHLSHSVSYWIWMTDKTAHILPFKGENKSNATWVQFECDRDFSNISLHPKVNSAALNLNFTIAVCGTGEL